MREEAYAMNAVWKSRRGLYPIVDVDSLRKRGLDPLRFGEAVLAASPPLLQIRAKTSSDSQVLALAKGLRPYCARSQTALVINDRVDVAVLSGAMFVHLGQGDLSVDDVRRAFPAIRVGLSTHTLAQVRRAKATSPDYIAFGPVFETPSKMDAEPTTGLAQLSEAATIAAFTPLVAIGGISAQSIAEVARIVAFAAVISAAMADDLNECTLRAKSLQRIMEGE